MQNEGRVWAWRKKKNFGAVLPVNLSTKAMHPTRETEGGSVPTTKVQYCTWELSCARRCRVTLVPGLA